MRTSNIILAALTAAIAFSAAPAEARRHQAAPGYQKPSLDVAAIPAYPLHDASTASHSHARAAKRSRTARRPAPAAHAAPWPSLARSGLVTVETAAGIPITVAASFAAPIQGFIADLVARGYHPRQIHCYARDGHVHNSLHYSGHACDFDQRGWGQTARPMYHVGDLVRKWALRDGAEFRDWGHIDDGPHLRRGSRAQLVASHPPFYGATADYKASRL